MSLSLSFAVPLFLSLTQSHSPFLPLFRVCISVSLNDIYYIYMCMYMCVCSSKGLCSCHAPVSLYHVNT